MYGRRNLCVLITVMVLGAAGCPKNGNNQPASGGQPDPAPASQPAPPPDPAKPAPAAKDEAKAAPEAKTAPAAEGEKKANPQVLLVTSMGEIKLELNRAKAPGTVENFLKYVASGHYKGTVFHRVIAGFMIQGGGFDTKLTKKETRAPIQNEADNGLKNVKFSVAMARTPDPHSAAAQFFINVTDNVFLNHRDKSQRGWGYCVFGKVIAGQEVVEKIRQVKTGSCGQFPTDCPAEQVLIKDAKAL